MATPSFKDGMAVKAVGAMNLSLLGVGERVGAFKKLRSGPISSDDLADAISCDRRYIKEWCLHMGATGVLNYDAGTGKYDMTDDFKEALDDPGDCLNLAHTIPAIINPERLYAAFKSGDGFGWDQHCPGLYEGTCRFFKPVYQGYLVTVMPTEVKTTLQNGGCLADVGCGQGFSSLIMAKAFPQARIVGFDLHAPSIDAAEASAKSQGVTNAEFVVADASTFADPKGDKFDAICFLDCFHDMAVASKAAVQAKAMLKPGGTVFLIEPLAGENDKPEEHLACGFPTSLFSGFSLHVCLPCGKCMDGGDALGTCCATATHRSIFQAAGFASLDSIENEITSMGFRTLVAK